MKVKQLKIKSFRGFDDLTLDFDPDEPTVFIGVNGSGKSSILDCLSILLSWLLKRIENPKSSGQFFDDLDIKNKHKSTHNTITISFDDLSKITWSLTKTKKGRSQEAGSDFTQLKNVIEEIHNQLDLNSKTAIPLAVYYPTKRAVIDIPLRIRTKHPFEQVNAYDQALEKGKIDFIRFFEWFRNREDLENEIRLTPPLMELLNNQENSENYLSPNYSHRDSELEAVRKAISQMLDGFTNLRVKRSPLRMTVEKQGEQLIIAQLSDGEKCLLAMVGDLARRLAMANPDLENKLEGSGVVLIDEIELHLHPKWQRKIIPSLTKTFPNCQFIVTTHCPQVISGVKWCHLIMETDSDSLVVEKVRTYGKDSNRILKTLMGVSERSEKVQKDFDNLFELIDEEKLEEAELARENITQEMGDEDPQLVKADWLIERTRIMNNEED